MPERLNANLIREYADGELAGERASAFLESLQGEDAAAAAARMQVISERRLREHVKAAMSPAVAPGALHQRVQIMMIESAEAATETGSERVPLASTASRAMPAPVRRPRPAWTRVFASPQHANALALAAVLALIAGAVLFGIFGPTVDEMEAPPANPTDLAANAAEYADGVHGMCTENTERLLSQAKWLAPAQAQDELSKMLGSPIQVFDLTSLGYEFVGGGPSGMPFEKVPSGHLIYRKTKPNGKTAGMVSVFMAPARGCCKRMCEKLKPREWQNASGNSDRCIHKVLYSTDRKMVYFLVCCDESDLDPVAEIVAQSSGEN